MKKIFRLFILLIVIFIAINHRYFMKKIYPIYYQKEVYNYSMKYNLDPVLVFAVIKTESNFNKNAVSCKGAVGLMQITPSTGEYIAKLLKDKNYKMENLLEPSTNIRYGCFYLRRLIDIYHGDLNKALMAYNAGEGNVGKWIEHLGEDLDIESIPFGETRLYVKKINKYYKIYKYIYSDIDN